MWNKQIENIEVKTVGGILNQIKLTDEMLYTCSTGKLIFQNLWSIIANSVHVIYVNYFSLLLRFYSRGIHVCVCEHTSACAFANVMTKKNYTKNTLNSFLLHNEMWETYTLCTGCIKHNASLVLSLYTGVLGLFLVENLTIPHHSRIWKWPLDVSRKTDIDNSILINI